MEFFFGFMQYRLTFYWRRNVCLVTRNAYFLTNAFWENAFIFKHCKYSYQDGMARDQIKFRFRTDFRLSRWTARYNNFLVFISTFLFYYFFVITIYLFAESWLKLEIFMIPAKRMLCNCTMLCTCQSGNLSKTNYFLLIIAVLSHHVYYNIIFVRPGAWKVSCLKHDFVKKKSRLTDLTVLTSQINCWFTKGVSLFNVYKSK